MLPIHEYILWPNCNNNCKFCWQKKEKQFDEKQQLESIHLISEEVSKLKDSHVLFVGGEIFDIKNQNIVNAILTLFNMTIAKMIKGDIELLYINTNLLYDIHSYLINVLEVLNAKELLSRVHFTTSADEYGRFSYTKYGLFYDNLKYIRRLYDKLPIYVNMILTRQFCEDVLNDRFDIKEYQEALRVEINTIPYIKFGKVIEAPDKEMVFQTILHLDEQLPGYGIKYCDNFLLNQNIILQEVKKGKLIDVSSNKSDCGHSENFRKCYSDSNTCFVCDCAEIKKTLEEWYSL